MIFAVIRSRGSAWNSSTGLEQQENWSGHAAFMNGLHREGFVRVVGPLEGTDDVLLIVEAANEADVRSRLSEDPWGEQMLQTTRVTGWSIRLGSLAASAPR